MDSRQPYLAFDTGTDGPQPPVAPPQMSPATGWWERNQRNKPQSSSLGPVVFINLIGGMGMSWSLGLSTESIVPSYTLITWFVTVIVGALLGAALTNYLRKRIILLVAQSLVLCGGILFLIGSTNIMIVQLARNMNGFAFGLVIAPGIVMGGEEYVKDIRGMGMSSMGSVAFTLGTLLNFIYGSRWVHSGPTNLNVSHGVMCLVYGLASLVFTFIKHVESPVYLLLRGQEEQAIDCLRRLQSPFIVTNETMEQLEEHKLYIAKNKEMTLAESIHQSLPALLKLCLLRALNALSFTLVVNHAFITATVLLPIPANPVHMFAAFILCRCLGAFIGMLTVDIGGRKRPLIYSTLVSGTIAIAVAVLFNDLKFITNSTNAMSVVCFLFVFQFVTGLSMSSSSAYLSEAFPLAVKPFCIAIAYSIEMLVHVVIESVPLEFESIQIYFWVLGIFSLFCVPFAVINLPETKRTTLLEAQDKFRNFLAKDTS